MRRAGEEAPGGMQKQTKEWNNLDPRLSQPPLDPRFLMSPRLRTTGH